MQSFVPVSADRSGITFHWVPASLSSIDICFDEQRVWSLDVRDIAGGTELPWPEALHPFLIGSSTLTIAPTGDTEALWSGEVAFTSGDARVAIVNDAGVGLSLNKWLRLAPNLTEMGQDVRDEIVRRAAVIIDNLTDMGLRPFVVGGTLLGGVRDGSLLPHDDDADVAYLSRFTTPAEVAREGYQVGRRLEALGYTLMRHSATHMQLHFATDSGVDYYIDVFAAFFTDDGNINQPFHVRGPMREADMLPFSQVTIGGTVFPAPRVPEVWLEINYDADWRTPIPGFVIETPEPTRRRFQNWFGSFNFGRHFWNGWYAHPDAYAPWEPGAEWITDPARSLQAPQLVELGAGGGSLTRRLASPTREVIATDYAREPLTHLKRLSKQANVRAAHVNLYRITSLAAPAENGVTGPFDLVAHHVFEQVTEHARPNMYRLARMALNSGGTAVGTFFTHHAADLAPDNPTTWHLTPEQLRAEAAAFGLEARVQPLAATPDAAGSAATASAGLSEAARSAALERQPFGVTFTLAPTRSSTSTQGAPMSSPLSRLFRAVDPRITRAKVRELNEQVQQLQTELDEYRGHSSKLAELLDLAENQLSPESRGGAGSGTGPSATPSAE